MNQDYGWNHLTAAPPGGPAIAGQDAAQAELESLVDDLERSVAKVHKTAAQALISGGDYARALKHARALTTFSPGDPEGWNMLGWLLYLEGDDEGAVAAFDRGLALAPGQGDILYNKGMVFYGKGRVDEAEALWSQAVDAGCRTAELYNNLGVIHYSKGRTAESVRFFQMALQVDPEYAEAKENLAACQAAPVPGPAPAPAW